MIVEAEPGSCQQYTTAFNMCAFAKKQSEPAGEAASRVQKRIRDAHMAAVPEYNHDSRCALYGGPDPKNDWLYLGYEQLPPRDQSSQSDE